MFFEIEILDVVVIKWNGFAILGVIFIENIETLVAQYLKWQSVHLTLVKSKLISISILRGLVQLEGVV